MPTTSASTPDAYAVLGVRRAAAADEIRAAHRRLVRLHHPDANPRGGAPAAAESAQWRFQQVQEAYDLLRDAARRAALDQHLQRLDAERQRAATEAARAAAAPDEAQAHRPAPRYEVDEIERERRRREEAGGRRYPTPRGPHDETTSRCDKPSTAGTSRSDDPDSAASRRRANPKFKSEQEAIDQLIEELKELRSRPGPLDAPPSPPPVEVGQVRRAWREVRVWAHWLFDGYNALWTVGTFVTVLIATSLAMWGFDRTRELVGFTLVALFAGLCVMIITVPMLFGATLALRKLVDHLGSILRSDRST
jgi:curved DNA-binding protein CbpA